MNRVLFDAPGPKARRRITTLQIAGMILVLVIAAFAGQRLNERDFFSPETWSVLVRPDFLLLLLKGVGATVQVAAASMVLSFALGVAFCSGRLSLSRWISVPTGAAVHILRGLPVLLLIFFLYLGAPAMGIPVSPFWALVIGISIYNAAFIGEIYRAGISSLPAGQSEAAQSLGLSRGKTFRYVLVPQAVKIMLPALISQLVIILKEGALGFIVGYPELLRDGAGAVEFLGASYAVPIFTAIGVIYLALNFGISGLARLMEKRSQKRQIPTLPAVLEEQPV